METLQTALNPQGTNDAAPNKEAIAAANEALSWLEPLCADVNFRRFMETVFGPAVRENHLAALDVSKPARTRDKFAQRHFALSYIFNWPQNQRDAHRKTIEKQQEKRDAKEQTAKFPGSPL